MDKMLLDDVTNQIESILNNLKPPKLDAYLYTQNRLHKTDVAKDRAYQKTYNGFYRVRLPKTKAYEEYYALLEKNKSNNAISLEEIMCNLQEVTSRIEASFASKLLATVNPNIAPLDSIVLGHLNLCLPNYREEERLKKCVDVHKELVNKMQALIAYDANFKTIKRAFNTKFPEYTFTDIKILDLILWQYRPKA